MRGMTRSLGVLALVLLMVFGPALAVTAAPEEQRGWAVHISLAPVYFEPAEAPGLSTPFMRYYALHDALVKPITLRSRQHDIGSPAHTRGGHHEWHAADGRA